jgi:hypothetical protein
MMLAGVCGTTGAAVAICVANAHPTTAPPTKGPHRPFFLASKGAILDIWDCCGATKALVVLAHTANVRKIQLENFIVSSSSIVVVVAFLLSDVVMLIIMRSPKKNDGFFSRILRRKNDWMTDDTKNSRRRVSIADALGLTNQKTVTKQAAAVVPSILLRSNGCVDFDELCRYSSHTLH